MIVDLACSTHVPIRINTWRSLRLLTGSLQKYIQARRATERKFGPLVKKYWWVLSPSVCKKMLMLFLFGKAHIDFKVQVSAKKLPVL